MTTSMLSGELLAIRAQAIWVLEGPGLAWGLPQREARPPSKQGCCGSKDCVVCTGDGGPCCRMKFVS